MSRRFPFHLLYPNVCPVCRLRQPKTETSLCRECDRDLPYMPQPSCPACGGALDTPHAQCRECLDNPRKWANAATALDFTGLARNCVHRFKYHGDIVLAPLLAAAAWEAWRRHHTKVAIDFLAPVPLHWWRRLTRGYNQSDLLCRELSQRAGLPQKNVLKRIRWTSPQASLSRRARKENLRRAFRVKNPDTVNDKRILLIDDVLTTGATLGECTRRLLQAGAREVHVLTVARRR